MLVLLVEVVEMHFSVSETSVHQDIENKIINVKFILITFPLKP